MKLLCISNGHGEDAIAVTVLQELRQLPQPPEIAALPIVGLGAAYSNRDIPIVGTVKTLPSGGFLNQDNRQLVRDLQGGAIGLTLSQMRTIRDWGRAGGKILAVGDIVPLIFAYLSGAEYAFIGTAKSEYYIRDANGQILPSQRDSIEVKTGSYYFPWERWLLSRAKCRVVFPRDRLTAENLQERGVFAWDLGNPMMDGVDISGDLPPFDPVAAVHSDRPLAITLLPGSRPPEAYANWEQIVIAVNSTIAAHAPRPIVGLAAIVPTLDLDTLEGILARSGWQRADEVTIDLPNFVPDPNARYYRRDRAAIVLSTQAFSRYMQLGDCAIAMAGTATEQFIGLGKPAFTIPGAGPQFTPKFAEAQTRLFGESVILVPTAQAVGGEIAALWQQPDRLESIAANGLVRMGNPGAAARIAAKLSRILDIHPTSNRD